MSEIEARSSVTYKLKAPEITEHAIYFTIVGGKNPDSFFINSKEMKSISFAMTTALMTSYSHRIKDGTPIEKIIADMKETFDAAGGYVIPKSGGQTARSLVHHLGLILEEHIEELKCES